MQYVCWDQRLLSCMAYTQFQVSKSISDIAFTSEINLEASNSEMQYCHQNVSSMIWPKFLYIHVLGYFELDNWYLNSFYWLRANCLGTNHIISSFICQLLRSTLPVILAVYYLFNCEMSTTQNSFLWAQLVVWFYDVRERIFIDLKFTWGFEVHTKTSIYIST